MIIKEFLYILKVAECGTISKAAEELYISQPALTRYIHNLESSLNMKLFEKMGRNVKLTPFGQVYVDAGKKILKICDDLEQEANASDDMIRGTLRIGCGRRGSYILPEIIPEYSKRFPSVSLKMSESSYAEVESMLIQGKVDIGILKEPTDFALNYLTCIPLFKEELVLVTPVNHPLNRFAEERPGCSHKWIDLSLFRENNFICYKTGHRNRVLIDKLMLENGLAPNYYFETNNVDGMIHLVRGGYGVCFSPEIYAKNRLIIDEDHPSIEIFSIGDPVNRYQYCAAYRTNSHVTRYMQVFLEMLEKHYQGK
ncbi:MAG: LysR family transcriptional regulator [Lachnospiraceae bacterium]|nr:LysR family transcriptional regulator [Lachnospiraceae bacterium]